MGLAIGLAFPFRVERVTCDVEAFHFGVADLDAFYVDPLAEGALHFSPAFVVIAPINSTVATRSVKGQPPPARGMRLSTGSPASRSSSHG